MKKTPPTTKLDPSGLRYKSKAGGSPFVTAGHGTMSCFKCGQHKPRASGTFKTRQNIRMFICADCQVVGK